MVAPSEPAVLRALGKVKLLPERYGVDIMWGSTVHGLCGIQRKEFPGDFLSSMEDGRLSVQRAQMQALHLRVLVLEGRGTWTIDGELVSRFGQPWSRSAHRRYLCSLQAEGIWVLTTDGLDDTVACVQDVEAWSKKAEHKSAQHRPGVKRDRWGRATDRASKVHFIQGIDGIGAGLAERILDQVGMPFGLRVSEAELAKVHGLGKGRLKQISRVLEGPEPELEPKP